MVYHFDIDGSHGREFLAMKPPDYLRYFVEPGVGRLEIQPVAR